MAKVAEHEEVHSGSMNLTPYHAKYFAYELTKRCSSDSDEKMSVAVAGAQGAEIGETMTNTRRKLLEYFDDEVREKLKVRDEASREYLNRHERLLMQLTRHELAGHAAFPNDSAFRLDSNLFPRDIPLGLYELPRRSGEAHLYRIGHPLAKSVLAQAKDRDLPVSHLVFYYGAYEGKITILEPLIGKSGSLALSVFTAESFDQAEDHLIFAAVTDDSETLDEEAARSLFSLPATANAADSGPAVDTGRLDAIADQRQAQIKHGISELNARFFEAEVDKLEGWADDLKLGLERELKELNREIKEVRRAAKMAPNLDEKLAGQKQLKALEAQRSQKRRSLFDAQDEVDEQREQLISQIEGKLAQRSASTILFTICWVLK